MLVHKEGDSTVQCVNPTSKYILNCTTLLVNKEGDSTLQ